MSELPPDLHHRDTVAGDAPAARRPRTLRYHSTAGARPMSAGRIILVGIIAFTLAGLLNADSLHAEASRQPFGWQRSALLDLVGPVRSLSHATRLNRPHADIVQAIGKPPIDRRRPPSP